MDKKITRRAVLGTVVAALAAGPFVIRTFRKPKQLEFGEYHDPEEMEFLARNGYTKMCGDFFDQWRDIYSKFDAAFEKEDLNDSQTLRLDFSRSSNRRFRYLSTHILDGISSLSDCTPKNLSSFEYSEGVVSTNNGTLNVSMDKREKVWYGIGIGEDINPLSVPKIHAAPREIGSFSVRKNDDGLFLAIGKDGRGIASEKEARRANYPGLIAEDFLRLLVYPYPENHRLEVGAAVNLSQEGIGKILSHRLPSNFEFVAMGRVGNARVSRFISSGTVTQDSFVTIQKTLDICVDIISGFTILRKEFETTKYSNNVAFDTDTRVKVFMVS